MDDARLDCGQRPHVPNHLGQTLQAIADHEEGVLDASVAQVGQHAHPELRALTPPVPDHNPNTSFSPAKLTPIAA